MPVIFPKAIVIENSRLTTFWLSLCILCVGALLFELFFAFAYFEEVDAAADITVVIWASVGSENSSESVDDYMCSNLDHFEYCYDTSCGYAFLNNTCLPICDDSYSGSHCAQWWELSNSGLHLDKVMFATHIREDFFITDETSDDNASDLNNYLIMETHRWKVSFMYSQTVPEYDFPGYTESVSSSTDTILTVLVDPDGEVIGTYEPDVNVQLTWDEVASASGYASLLDSVISQAGTNGLEGAYYEDGPIVRLPGIEIYLIVSCSNDNDLLEYDVTIDWSGPACLVEISVPDFPRTWPSYVKHFYDQDTTVLRRRRYHGVYIVTKTSGTYYYVSGYNIYEWLLLGTVLIAIPSKIVQFVATNLCGHISTVYGHCIKERYNLLDQLAATATMLSLNTSVIQTIVGEEGLTKELFTAFMALGLRERLGDGLDPADSCTLVDICFHQMLMKSRSHARRLSELLPASHAEEACNFEGDGCQDVSRGTLLQLAMLESNVGLSDLVLLFQHHRKRNRLEEAFTPHALKEVLRSSASQEHVDDIQATMTRTLSQKPGIRPDDDGSMVQEEQEGKDEGVNEDEKQDISQAPTVPSKMNRSGSRKLSRMRTGDDLLARCDVQAQIDELRASAEELRESVSRRMHNLAKALRTLGELERSRIEASTVDSATAALSLSWPGALLSSTYNSLGEHSVGAAQMPELPQRNSGATTAGHGDRTEQRLDALERQVAALLSSVNARSVEAAFLQDVDNATPRLCERTESNAAAGLAGLRIGAASSSSSTWGDGAMGKRGSAVASLAAIRTHLAGGTSVATVPALVAGGGGGEAPMCAQKGPLAPSLPDGAECALAPSPPTPMSVPFTSPAAQVPAALPQLPPPLGRAVLPQERT
eukprot:NODE_677_length_2843_cov_16.037187.p1 GENE.NODE_677_length_2843_cov_16.037187~~NODE_677_length_2843_cov_16.037187.p1  ORF type:complete len:878 (-),score=231.71 NODE_677_length_2843_cov_16.037187:182-2815(-)